MNTVADQRTVDRANDLLEATRYFDDLGLNQLAHDARTVAGLTVELVHEVEAERSARIALQARVDKATEIFGRSAFHAAVAQGRIEDAIADGITTPTGIEWPS